MNKWYRTTRTSFGGGTAVKTMDCEFIERFIIDTLEGKKEELKEVIFGDQWNVVGYQLSKQNTGYTFHISDKNNKMWMDLDDWKYVCIEEFRNTLFIYATDYKPVE